MVTKIPFFIANQIYIDLVNITAGDVYFKHKKYFFSKSDIILFSCI
jgi:hypothetical protein